MPGNRGILIIEDNPGDVRLMREALRDFEPPLAIQVAGDGEEALRILKGQGPHAGGPKPSLIFLDFNLPRADSRDILRQMKEDPRLRLIPVAVFTTSDSERDIRTAYELYANCYLRKPGDLDGFLKTIAAAADFWLNVAYVPADIPETGPKREYLL